MKIEYDAFCSPEFRKEAPYMIQVIKKCFHLLGYYDVKNILCFRVKKEIKFDAIGISNQYLAIKIRTHSHEPLRCLLPDSVEVGNLLDEYTVNFLSAALERYVEVNSNEAGIWFMIYRYGYEPENFSPLNKYKRKSSHDKQLQCG